MTSPPSSGPSDDAEPFQLEFGTAGVRGEVGPGPRRLNERTVGYFADGLAAAVLEATRPQRPRVVLGHDARHGSTAFAGVLTERLTAAGIDVHRFQGPVPTPLVPRAVRRCGADAGVVITASHNPARDNGIKVYGADGVLIVAPLDDAIATSVRAVARGSLALGAPAVPGRVIDLGGVDGALADEFVGAAIAAAGGPVGAGLTVATTSLHGVGAALLERVLDAAGVRNHPVPSQRAPDPDFPTVAFPNPEEPGAMEAVLALAADLGADVALANDPDADRLAVAVQRSSTDTATSASYWQLTGDELGAVFAHHLLAAAPDTPAFVATTFVSSRLVPTMAAARGVDAVVTPTGFKWLCHEAQRRPGQQQLFAYEEALGYAIGPEATDKDGITAAVVALAALRVLPRRPGTSLGDAVDDLFDDLATRFGAHATYNGAVRLDRPAPDLMHRIADTATIGSQQVVSTDSPHPGVVRWFLHDDTRVIVRPSGTEPKVKYYCEAVVPVGPDGARSARSAAAQHAASTARALDALLRAAVID